MSNQSVNGFQGSQPFITDNQYKSLSLEQLRYILNQKKKTIQKSYNELSEKEKLIRDIRRLDKLNEKVKKGIDIKKKYKKKKASKKKKIKTFEEYYKECIKNKKIPKDTPDYFRVALEQAMREHEYKNKENLVKEKSSLEGFANKYIIEGIPGLSPEQYFERINKTLVDFLTYHRNVKFNLLLICMMEKQNIKQKQIIELEEGKAYFHSGTFINFRSTDVDKLISNCWESISARIEAYTEAGSAWYFKEVDRLEIHTTEHNPTKGSSYIDLPKWIKDKKAIINIKNKDNKCFLWCILRYLYPKERDAEWIGDLKKYENSLNTKGITFPISKNDINKFENLNPDLPGINIFYLDEKECIRPMREIKNKDCKNTIDLFLIEEDGKSHYTLIKNFHRLFRSQKTGSNNGKLFICKRCFWHFSKEELLDKHLEYCSNNKTAVVTMPKPNTYLHFKNYYKQLPVPFVVYADFECFTKPMNSCSPNPKDSYNYNYQKHEPSGFCFYVKGIVPGIHITPITYTKTSEDDNVAKIFILKLEEVTKGIYNDFYKRFKPLVMSAKDQKLFNETKTCHICSLELKDDKVRDHCHFTGQYRGAAHNKCNLKCRKPKVLPVIFHNLQGYDAHLFIKQLYRLEGDLVCIPSTEEKYITFNKKIKVDEINGADITFEIRFIDSFKFLQTSLANLVSNLQPSDFHITKHVFKSNTSLLTRKGVYPYDYVSSLDKLSETQLPPKEEFYSQLNDEHISDEDYQHAINVWNTLGCKTIRDYHDLYLKSDVLLLADVFENFRATCLKHYKPDPAHY